MSKLKNSEDWDSYVTVEKIKRKPSDLSKKHKKTKKKSKDNDYN